jgi:amino acid permease
MINQGESVPLVGKEIGLSTFGTTLNIVKAILGIGTFIMPAATEEGGIGMMVATMMGVGLMSLYTFVLIYRAAVLVGTHEVTYPEIARTAFGKVGEALAVLALSLMTLGCALCSYCS